MSLNEACDVAYTFFASPVLENIAASFSPVLCLADAGIVQI